MTKPMSFNEKKFSKMAQGLNHTWNCDGQCKDCIFTIDESMRALIKENTDNDRCGAIAIRTLAQKMFKTPKAKKFMDRI